MLQNITWLSNQSFSDTKMTEAIGSSVIDTACPRIAFGEKRINDYINGSPRSELLKINNKKLQDHLDLVMAKLFTPQEK